jgi:hypothetical protein
MATFEFLFGGKTYFVAIVTFPFFVALGVFEFIQKRNGGKETPLNNGKLARDQPCLGASKTT